MASSKEKQECSFTKEMEFEVQHFGANFKQLENMIKRTVKDPREQERLISEAARLTL